MKIPDLKETDILLLEKEMDHDERETAGNEIIHIARWIMLPFPPLISAAPSAVVQNVLLWNSTNWNHSVSR